MVDSKSNSNIHLKLRSDELETLNQTFSKHETRVIQNDFTIRFKNSFYQLFRNPKLKYTLKK
jgi:hypothetical protein